MTIKIKKYISAAGAIIKYESIFDLLCRASKSLLHRVIFIENYYVEIASLSGPFEPGDYLPKVEDYHACIISTNKEADELLSQGYTFGAYELNLRSTLDKGARTCAIFIDKEFAHMITKTDNARGKDAVDSRPFHVDFDKGDIVGGKAFTVPKFRRLGLRKYSLYMMRKDDQERGYRNAYATITMSNLPSLKYAAQNPYNKIISKCRYIKILCFKYFKETKLGPIGVKELLEQISKSD